MAEMQAKYPDDKFEVLLRRPNGTTPEWRVRCLDCPGKVRAPSRTTRTGLTASTALYAWSGRVTQQLRSASEESSTSWEGAGSVEWNDAIILIYYSFFIDFLRATSIILVSMHFLLSFRLLLLC